jgi:hypothetical protein
MNRVQRLQRRRRIDRVTASVAGLILVVGAFAFVGDGGAENSAPTTTTTRTTRAATAESSAVSTTVDIRQRETARANRWNGRDLDCGDFTVSRISIGATDPNDLDSDGNGTACEATP